MLSMKFIWVYNVDRRGRDYRSTSDPVLQYVESHNDDVTEVSLYCCGLSVLHMGVTFDSWPFIRPQHLVSSREAPMD